MNVCRACLVALLLLSYWPAVGLAQGTKGTQATAAAADSSPQLFGYARIKPVYFSNFDFDDNAHDMPVLTEAGFVSREHLRAELRLGVKASGQRWSIKLLAEADMVLDSSTVDRSFYAGAEKEGQPNTGGEFGI